MKMKQTPTLNVDAVFLSLEEPSEKCDLCALIASMMDAFLVLV